MHKILLSSFLPIRLAICLACLCLAFIAQSQVYVGGIISSDSTFSPQYNPYIVNQDLKIIKGASLTLLPGVEILFEHGTSLISNGTLIVRGSPDKKIKFLPKNQIVEAGQWNGLIWNNAATEYQPDSSYLSGSVLSYAEISGASFAVTLDKNSSMLIENNTVYQSSFGINLLGATNNVIRNCIFADGNYGIFLADGFLDDRNKIYSNTFLRCLETGLFINSNAALSNHNYIGNNKFISCNIGLHLGNYGKKGSAYNVISDNSFNQNFDAIQLFHDSNTISNNYFMQNSNGIFSWQADHNIILHNLFSHHWQNAITLAGGSSFNTITFNSMNNNSGGVWIKPDSSRNCLLNSFLYNTLYNNYDYSFQILNTPQGPIQFNNIANNGSYQSFKNMADSLLDGQYNYWGTSAQLAIDSILYDKSDEPAFGEVSYKPFLDKVLTTAPVPPPDKVIKQQIGNNILLSWSPEAVADIKGYKVYYGNNNGIVYAHSIENSTNTYILLSGVSIDDTIAVTAINIQANGNHDQTQGHESDFAIGIAYPYAGPDTAICYYTPYSIKTASAQNFGSYSWTTSGDGSFSNKYILQPVYFPGNQDYENGHVLLQLTAVSGEAIYYDEAQLTFRQPPQAYAGNDTLITTDSVLFLDRASAKGYSLLHWATSGDGVFSSDTLQNPIYYPGPADIKAGSAVLTLIAFSICEVVTDNISLTIVPAFSIHGRIHAGNSPAFNCTVQLYQVKQGNIQPHRSPIYSADGDFDYYSLLAGNYYIYAIPDKTITEGYLPTYFFNNLRWQDAYRLDLNANTYDVDIDLEKSHLSMPLGSAEMSGYCTTLPGSTGKCGDIMILLYDKLMQNVLDWQEVRNSSDFSFSSLPFGDYFLVGERAGQEPLCSDPITLNPSQPSVDNIQLICTPSGYKFNTPTVPPPPSTTLSQILLFPNPFNDHLDINGLSVGSNYTVHIINPEGKIIENHELSAGSKTISLSTSNLSSGFYVVEIISQHNPLLHSKLIKQ